jgi:shikimate kinase
MEPRPRPIALVGLMGAGKSAVARALGERLGAAVADLDAMAEAESGCSIAALFAREGEAAFRRLEGRVLRDALASGAGVLACGGGVVLDAANRALLAGCCDVAWLEVEPAVAAARIAAAAATRPLLAAAGDEPGALARRLADLLAERQPLYEAVAAARVPGLGAPEDVAAAVLRALGRVAA